MNKIQNINFIIFNNIERMKNTFYIKKKEVRKKKKELK